MQYNPTTNPVQAINTQHIDALRRAHLDGAATLAAQSYAQSGTGSVALLHVTGIARFWEDNDAKALAARQYISDFLAGLHAQKIPFVFLVLGALDRINLFIGTFLDNEPNWERSPAGPAADRDTIRGALRSSFPGIAAAPADPGVFAAFSQFVGGAAGFGLITGIPTEKLGTERIGVEQMERLIRGMYGRHWGLVVVAKPIGAAKAGDYFRDAINEQSKIANEQTSLLQSPIAATYLEMVKRHTERMASGRAEGLWRVCPYVFGAGAADYAQAKAVTQAVFGGEASFPEPLRILDVPYTQRMVVANLGQPVDSAATTKLQPYLYATVLGSSELATFAHLPLEEMPGYSVREYARFDVAIPTGVADSKRRLPLGELIDYDRPTGNYYTVELDQLTKHCLIAGQTGTGKTNTAFYILKEAWKRQIPFLVIEPAKAEYRRLLADDEHPEIGAALRVFTLGDERVAPFRLNPFEVQRGVSVQTHIDLLRSVFGAAFAMYGPMPQLLEQCLLAIYRDRGWNLAAGENRRGIHPLSWPTLTDLYVKIDAVVESMGYGPRIGPELKAALKVRVNSLRVGSKGLMLDTPLSIPMDQLVARPTVLELEAIGDDDEKAFIMGVLWIFLYEHYRATAEESPDTLRHLTVIEEAHRLLTAVPMTSNAEIANPRGKAVEMFCNMLSEIRAYGEGMILADQIPTRLAPDAIKNTSLKIVHRLVAVDERAIVGGAMNMDETQMRYLSTLERGWATVFSEGDDRPVLVRVAPSKGSSLIVLTTDDYSTTGQPVITFGSNKTDDDLGIQLIDSFDNLGIVFESDSGYSSPPEIELEEAPPDQAESELDLESADPDEIMLADVLPSEDLLTLDLSPMAETGDILDIETPVPLNRTLSAEEKKLRAHMQATFWNTPDMAGLFKGNRPAEEELSLLDRARDISAEPELRVTFSRVALTVAAGLGPVRALDRLRELIRKYAAYDDDSRTEHLVLSLLAHDTFRRLGDVYGWPYAEVEKLENAWQTIVEAALNPGIVQIQIEGESEATEGFRRLYQQLCRRPYDPYPYCRQICSDGTCLYRYHLAPLVSDSRLDHRYIEGLRSAAASSGAPHEAIAAAIRHLGRDVAQMILEDDVPEAAKQRASACFLVQKGDALPNANQRQREREMKRGFAAVMPEI